MTGKPAAERRLQHRSGCWKRLSKSAAEFESQALRREKVIPPGATATVYIGPLQPGRYEFFDDFRPTNRGFVVAK
jgi:hypothetical protein